MHTSNPNLEAIRRASDRLAGVAVETPLLRNSLLDERVNANILIKPECLQRVGAFKFRGAYNRLALLDDTEKQRGVVAYSSGNHAQGVAYAAKLLGIPATIVMPSNAPQIKLERTRAYGAAVKLYDRETESREEIAQQWVESTGAVLIKPFDDPEIIAGQGTCGLEMIAQVNAQSLSMQMLLLPCGGGGLAAGVSTAAKALIPDIDIYGVEPVGFDDHVQSLRLGRRQAIQDGHQSICDALLIPQPGELTWEINRRTLAGGITVSDTEVARAISFACQHLKLVVEPGGAVALAAVLYNKIDLQGKTVGIILSGGNIDPQLLSECLLQWPNP